MSKGPRGLFRRGLASMPFQAANSERREQSPRPRMSFAPGATRPEGSKPGRRSLMAPIAVDKFVSSSSFSLRSGQSTLLPIPTSSAVSFPGIDASLQEKSPSSDWSSPWDEVTPRLPAVTEAAKNRDASSEAARDREPPSEAPSVQLPGQCMLEADTEAEATASETEGNSVNGDQSGARASKSRPNRRVRFAPDSKTPKPSSLIQMLSLVREVSDQFQDGKP